MGLSRLARLEAAIGKLDMMVLDTLWGLPTVESKAGSPPWAMRISATPSPFRSGSTAGL